MPVTAYKGLITHADDRDLPRAPFPFDSSLNGKVMSSGTDQDGLPKAARHLSAMAFDPG